MVKRKKSKEQSYFVEVIKQARVSEDGEWEYEVKWYGYDNEAQDNTWEPGENIEKSCERLVASFWAQFPDDPANPDPDFVVGQTLTPSARWIAQEKKLFKASILEAPESEEESSPPPKKKRKTSTTAARKDPTPPVASSSSSVAKTKTTKKSKPVILSDSSDSDEPLSKKRPSVKLSDSSSITVKTKDKGKGKSVDISSKPLSITVPKETSKSQDPSSERSTPTTARPALPRKNRIDTGKAAAISAASSPVVTEHVPPGLQKRPSLPQKSSSGPAPARSATLPNTVVSVPPTPKSTASGSGLSVKQRLTADAIRPTQVKNLTKAPPPVNTTISSFTGAGRHESLFNTNTLRSNSFKKPNVSANPRPGASTSVPKRPQLPPVQTAPTTVASPPPTQSPINFLEDPLVESPLEIAPPKPDPVQAQVDAFLSSIMPPQLAAPLRPAQMPVNDVGIRPTMKPVPVAASTRSTNSWSWSGSLALDKKGESEHVCAISIVNPTQVVPLQMPLNIAIGSKDKLSVRLYRAVDVPPIVAACKPASQFAQIICKNGEDDDRFSKMFRFMSEKRMIGILQIEADGHVLVCPPSSRIPGLDIPSECKGNQNFVAVALQWKLPPGEVREFNWKLVPSAQSPGACTTPSTSSKLPAVQRGFRILGFPEWLHTWLQSSTKRSYCVCSEGGDGSNKKVAMSLETESLYAILRQYKSAEDVGVLSDVRTLFIHVSCLRSLHKVKGLVQRRKRNLTTMFFLYGTHPEIDKRLWGMREIFPIGGIVTFDTTALIQDPIGALTRMEQASEHPLWATYMLPSVLALATKLVYKGEDPLAALEKGEYIFDEVLSAVVSKKIALMRAPPDFDQVIQGKTPSADAWISDQLSLDFKDPREILGTCLKDFETRYGRGTPETHLRAVRDEVTKDMVRMQTQLAIMTNYRRFVVLLARQANETSDSDIIEYSALSSFQWMDDYFTETA